MRAGVVPVAIAAAVALAACDLDPSPRSRLPASGLECGGTEPALCQRVARLGIAQMNLTATGPITAVTLESQDCDESARERLGGWRGAEACWSLVVTGERSLGWGVVVLWPNGDLEPFW